jgi:hypothetical protein
MNPQGAAVGQDLQDILRNSFSTKFDYRGTETMATNVQRFLDGQARKSNASITSNVYNALMDTLGRADEANVSFLDSALSTVAVTNALANQDYNAALKALRESLLELEPNKQLTLVSFSNNLRLELSAAGKTGDPQAIYTAMVTGLKSIKRGSQQPDNNTLRELYFEHLDATSQSIMIHIKKDHDRSDSSWQQFHRIVLETLKDLSITRASQPKQVMIADAATNNVIMAVEPQPAENKEAHRETRGRYRSPEVERTYRSRDRERSRRPQNNYGHPQDSENATHRRERSNSIHRSRMCRQCPAGREERHLHLPQDCKYGFQGRGGFQRRDGFGINQRNGFSQVNRGGFGNERGRGGFGNQNLRRQN